MFSFLKKKPKPAEQIVVCSLYPNITCPKCGMVLVLQLDRTFKCNTPHCPLSKGTFQAPSLDVTWKADQNS